MKAVSISLEPEPGSVRAARSFVDSTLEDWSCAHLSDMAVLLVSELVTNSVLHAAAPIRVTVSPDGANIRVSVHDEGDGLPVRRDAMVEATSGRGLALVDMLSAAWGVVAADVGKTVWFDLAR